MNFLTGFSSVNGATPANEFHTSIRREPGHSAASLASSFSLANACRLSPAAGTSTCAAMLFSVSMVNVATWVFSFVRLSLAVVTFITRKRAKGKLNRTGSGEILSSARKRALESPGRAWR